MLCAAPNLLAKAWLKASISQASWIGIKQESMQWRKHVRIVANKHAASKGTLATAGCLEYSSLYWCCTGAQTAAARACNSTAQCFFIAVVSCHPWDVIITIMSSPGIWMYAVSRRPWKSEWCRAIPESQESYHAVPRIQRHLHGCHTGMVIMQVMMLTRIQIHAHASMTVVFTIHLQQFRFCIPQELICL